MTALRLGRLQGRPYSISLKLCSPLLFRMRIRYRPGCRFFQSDNIARAYLAARPGLMAVYLNQRLSVSASIAKSRLQTSLNYCPFPASVNRRATLERVRNGKRSHRLMKAPVAPLAQT
jgi:hypothetical protein